MPEVAELISRAVTCKIDGQYDEALELLREALQTAPDNARIHFELGLVLGFIGEFDDSLAEIQQAVTLSPNNIEYINNLGLTCAMLGMYDEAKQAFEQVLQLDPCDEVALKNIVFFT